MANSDFDLLDLYDSLGHADKRYFRPIPISYGVLRPGDLIQFKYDLSEEGEPSYYDRLCLVVRNQTGKIGYTSLRNNQLLSCYRLNDAPTSLLKQIILNLAGKRNLANYDTIQSGLKSLLGPINYHTYMLRRINRLVKFTPDLKKLKKIEVDE